MESRENMESQLQSLNRLSINLDKDLREKSQFHDVTARIFQLIGSGDVGELEYYLSTHIKSEIVKHTLFPLHVNRRRKSLSSTAPPFLNVACELGYRSIVALLLEYGANPLQETEEGTPLYVATLNGHDSIVQLLVQQRPENYLEIAQIIVENRIQDCTLETIDMFPGVMTNLLERWVQPYGHESQKLKAYWSGRGLHAFQEFWIKEPTYRDYLYAIDLSDNHDLRRIPAELIWSHPYLEILDISNNLLESLPEPLQADVSNNSRLVNINASRNELHSVPLAYFNLPHLQVLDLSRNLLTSLPKASTTSLWQCPDLSDLDISRNQLSTIPKSIEGATQLTKLNIAYNKLKCLPTSWNCPLERLHAEFNAITTLPSDLDKFWKRTLQYLNLSNNGIEAIPQCITELIALNSLKLSRNSIQSLPVEQDWKVQRLKHLDLSHNFLVFHQSQQAQASTEQSSLSKLKKNFLSIRPFSSSSSDEQTCNLHIQTSLAFPAEIQNSLNILSLAHNLMEAVPDGITTMCSLAELDISGNSKIQSIPEELGLLKNLDILRFDGVRPTNLPNHLIPDIAQRKVLTKDVLRCLRNSLRKAVRHLGIKLLIVGPEKCGKTTLLASLKKVSKKEILETKIENSCINIGDWKLRNYSNKKSTKDVDIVITYWDLSGAEKFDTINQCFLTPHALYLAVWDMTEGIEGIEKLRPHLLNIQARAPKSNVILVATHKDDYTGAGEDKQKLMEHIKACFIHKEGYPHIDGVITLAATQPNSDAMNKLRELIYSASMMLTDGKEKLLQKQIPLSYIKLREKIIAKKEQLLKSAQEDAIPPVMTEAELNDLVKQIPDNDITTDDDLQQAVLFLNHTGTILHYDEQLHGLNTIYFLEPAWLSSILSVVTRLQPHLVEQGRIEKCTLKELLAMNRCRDDLIERYIQLLARFEIILPYDDNKFIIPSKLPKEKPGFILNTNKFGKKALKIQRLYKMAFIPTGFWSRLVSRLIVNLQWLESTGSGNSKHVRKKLRNMTLGGSTIVKRQSFIMAGFKWDGRQTIYWRQGIAVTQGGNKGFFIVEPYYFHPDGSMGISISIESYMGDFSPLGFIVDQVEMLIQEWYPGFSGDDILGGTKLLERLVLCSDCLSKQKAEVSVRQSVFQGNIHTFTLTECAVAVCNNAIDLICPNHVELEVPLKLLVPDLLLEDISVTKILDEDLHLIKELNSGGFGVVYKAKYKMENVAVKKYHSTPSKSKTRRSGHHSQSSSGGEESKSATSSLGLPSIENLSEKEINDIIRSLSQLRAEVSLMSRLHHPFIISLIGLSISKLCFAMEYAPHGDLMSYLDDQSSRRCASAKFGAAEQGLPLDVKLTFKIANQIASALSYLHKKSIIYCDLKTDNVLLWSLNVNDKINIKMTDYGISKVNIMQGVRTSKGAPGFRAPEVERGMTFDQKVDIFSYGMVLYHLLTGMPPFHDQGRGEISMAIRNNQRPGYKFKEFNVVPEFPHLEEIVQACWRDDQQARPYIGEVLTAFKDPSFLAIQRVVEHKEPLDCIYSSVTNSGTYELWTWTGTSESRKLRRTSSRRKEKEIGIEEKNIQGFTVACMLKIGQSIILGSKTGRDGVIQVMTTPTGGMEHSEILSKTNLSSAPICMTYANKDDGSSASHIFIGQENGQVSIFKYEEKDSIDGPLINPPEWTLVKTLALNINHEPCNCMACVNDGSEIWIGSENNIHIINCRDLNQLDPIKVGADEERLVVKIMESRGDKLWCSCASPADVFQYNVKTHKREYTLHCSESAQGWVITMETSNLYKGRRVQLRSKDSQDMEDSEVSGSDNKDEDRMLAFNFGHYSENDDEQTEKCNPSRRKSDSIIHVWGQQKNGKTYTEFLREHSRPACKIKALLVIKDTLWVGRSHGDILVININEDSSYHYKYGEVLGVLSTYNLTQIDCGVVEHLIRLGSDQVIVSRLLPPKGSNDGNMFKLAQHNHSAKPRQQLLYLQAWGCEEFSWFENNKRKLVETEVNWSQRKQKSPEKKLTPSKLDVTI
ncbi:leucine-rich repeat serine/threonine-protein kinase 1-like [Anneissia japonica]|uniref:leucine-rich repeat serine/threonine-protein kinase 1-like n=1 Tax=Anneissia japonica TaxID=1529436 RepID=UPI001425AB31|nr:leucine-rich repeat serine/threonine-protein kinase 1-like [Anneissia japonica]